MKPNVHTGIILRHAVPSGSKAIGSWLHALVSLILFLGVAGIVGDVGGLWESFSPSAMVLSGVAVCLIYALLHSREKGNWFLPAVLGLIASGAIALGELTVDGACVAWNQFSRSWTAATGWLLPGLQLQTEWQTGALTVFCVVLGAMLAVGACLCGRNSGAVLAVLLPAAAFAAEWLLHTDLSGVWMFFLLAAAVLQLLQSGWSVRHGENSRPVLLGFLAILPAAVLIFGLLQVPVLKQWSGQMQAHTEEAIHRWRFETEHFALPEGDFTKEKKEGTGYTALMVTMEQPERVFLRGFVGDTFEEDQWLPTENTALEEEKELLYWLSREFFHPQGQLTAAMESAGFPIQLQQIYIQNLNGCSSTLYTPHTLVADSASNLVSERLEPSVVKAEGLKGQRQYSYTAVCDAQSHLLALLEQMQETEDQMVQDYRQAESSYRQFIRIGGLQVPGDFTAQLGELLDACCERHGAHTELTLAQAQASALDFLSLCFGDSGMEIPLPLEHVTDGQYQYVTVAVLALRYYGIPARYAEGYEITADMAVNAVPGEAITVDGSCGRAWVEVYQEGVGWMPMELTPGFEALVGQEGETGMSPIGVDGVDPHSQIGSVSGEGDGMSISEGKEQSSEDAEREEQEDNLSGGGTMVRIRKVIRWSSVVLAALIVLAVLLVVLRRVWKLRQKTRLFHQDDRSEAIAWIYTDAARLLSAMGFDRKDGSMEVVCSMVEQQDTAYGRRCREMNGLNEEALFSSHHLEERRRQEMLEFYRETLQRMKKTVKWYRKLWMQWALCLY